MRIVTRRVKRHVGDNLIALFYGEDLEKLENNKKLEVTLKFIGLLGVREAEVLHHGEFPYKFRRQGNRAVLFIETDKELPSLKGSELTRVRLLRHTSLYISSDKFTKAYLPHNMVEILEREH